MDKVIAVPVGSVKFPISLVGIKETLSEMESEHGAGLEARIVGSQMVVFTQGDICGCTGCLDLLDEFTQSADSWMSGSSRHMVVCSICGNKRCPHAQSHTYACGRSNEPGQEATLISKETS
jgi:hypothetical protein